MVNAGDLNPFKNVDIGIGQIGTVLLIFFLAIFIIGLIGVAIFLYINNKQYKHKIPLYKTIGNAPIKVANYKAKDFKIGKAGDKLWYVKKLKKYLPPATIQTAPHEYPHYEREDGEWINFGLPNIDEVSKKAGVKYVHQDMRSNRIAISNILDQRFQDQKSWWEKYGHLVTHLIFYIIVALMMVVIFYQFSDIVEKLGGLVDKLDGMQKTGGNGIVPTAQVVLLMFRRRK